MAFAWEADLKPGAKLVLLAIADHADGSGTCWPGQEHIAEKCGMNRSTVNQHINELIKDEFLFAEKRRGTGGRQATTMYRINIKTAVLEKPTLEKPTRKNRVTALDIPTLETTYPASENTTLETTYPELEKPTLDFPALEKPALEKQSSSVGNPNAYTFNEPSMNHHSFCSDPIGSSQTVIKIPLNVSGKLHEIFESDVAEYSKLYPAVDVMQQLRNMVGWCNANPTKRKTKGGIKRFINAWLAKEQDRGGSRLVQQATQSGNQKPIPEYIPPELRNSAFSVGQVIDSTAKRL